MLQLQGVQGLGQLPHCHYHCHGESRGGRPTTFHESAGWRMLGRGKPRAETGCSAARPSASFSPSGMSSVVCRLSSVVGRRIKEIRTNTRRSRMPCLPPRARWGRSPIFPASTRLNASPDAPRSAALATRLRLSRSFRCQGPGRQWNDRHNVPADAGWN
jgi:hypothetical protein